MTLSFPPKQVYGCGVADRIPVLPKKAGKEVTRLLCH